MNIKVEKIRIDKSHRIFNKLNTFEKWTKEAIEQDEEVRLFRCSTKCLLLKKYSVKKEKGIPDFCYEEQGNLVFVECKTKGRGLSYHQLKWIQNHSQFLTRVVFMEAILKRKMPDGVEEVYLHNL